MSAGDGIGADNNVVDGRCGGLGADGKCADEMSVGDTTGAANGTSWMGVGGMGVGVDWKGAANGTGGMGAVGAGDGIGAGGKSVGEKGDGMGARRKGAGDGSGGN